MSYISKILIILTIIILIIIIQKSNEKYPGCQPYGNRRSDKFSSFFPSE